MQSLIRGHWIHALINKRASFKLMAATKHWLLNWLALRLCDKKELFAQLQNIRGINAQNFVHCDIYIERV